MPIMVAEQVRCSVEASHEWEKPNKNFKDNEQLAAHATEYVAKAGIELREIRDGVLALTDMRLETKVTLCRFRARESFERETRRWTI